MDALILSYLWGCGEYDPLPDLGPHEEELLALLRRGIRRGAAAEELGFDRAALGLYLEAKPEFAGRVVQAEADANELVEEALFQAAASGNVQAARLWLERRQSAPVTSSSLELAAPAHADEALLRDLSTD